MSQIALSNDLIEITAEINIWKQQAGQAVFEIGKRLKHVKENDLAHGQWITWLESVDISARTAQAMIQAYDQFGKAQTSTHLPTGKIFEMLALPESVDRQGFIEKEHIIPSTGETKTVDEMTVKELREVKKSLQAAEHRAKQAEANANHFEKLWTQAKNQQPRTITQQVEVIPPDYQDLKKQASLTQELNSEVVKLKRSLNEQREHYESMFHKEEKKDQALKELRKNLSDLLRNESMFHESAVFYYNQIPGSREAYLAVTAFLTQYSDIVQNHFNEWKNLTAVKAAN